MKTVIEMAREALDLMAPDDHCREPYWTATNEELERFAALVAEAATEEANRRANASWTLMCEKMVAAEREACAKVCENRHWTIDSGNHFAAAIRARSNT